VVATDNIFGALNASAGMQFQPQGFGAYYTIVSNSDATNAVLDRAYAYPSNATSAYQLGKFYLDMPTDFGSMSDIRHLNYNWRLRIGFTQETLDLFDAQRVSAGTPSLVAGASYHPTTGVARFELWSKPTGVGQFAMRYVKKPSKLSGTTSIMEPLRGDVIINAALADVARWPGTSGLKNPMFDLNAYRMYDERFREGLQECWMKDIERNQTMVSYDQWSQLPYAPVDAKFVQNHFIF
jgi:hypothetical protein